eukprot:TRINITY_DN2977_c0_g1_i2.p1 TRINITY_DN2977_c0_g1~~TRINITY_DN2977_c0_g1_i2.p1  ORF type:complete len:565 (+),score=249.50 TRINITY_DN2977_c0_g1_i2:251-1696(+)
MGATDVCPIVPISDVTMDECVEYARALAKRIGEELAISVYCYENAAFSDKRRNLATCRAGEYEAMAKKVTTEEWKPCFGPTELNVTAGVTGVAARDFLVAYNVNLNTTSTRRANSVAFDLRENGRVKRIGCPITGEVVNGPDGKPERVPGLLKCCKAIGWYIEEYGICQVSVNLTNISVTTVHECFDTSCERATARGMRVTGSEVCGLVPLKVLTDAAKFYLKKQNRSTAISESELVKIAVKSLGLDDLAPFDPRERVIEYLLEDHLKKDTKQLIDMTLPAFCDETISESPAPGGGSIAAYCGALGASLAGMVANLSANKRGWDDRVPEFSEWGNKAMALKNKLVIYVDEDTNAFNEVMAAIKMPKGSDAEVAARTTAIEEANKGAAVVPWTVMQTSFEILEIAKAMATIGNPASVTDAGVGALCARTAIEGAFLNVKVNLGSVSDKEWVADMKTKSTSLLEKAKKVEAEIMKQVHTVLDA